jgi:hypothetical protein
MTGELIGPYRIIDKIGDRDLVVSLQREFQVSALRQHSSVSAPDLPSCNPSGRAEIQLV